MLAHTLRLNPRDPSGRVLVEGDVFERICAFRQDDQFKPEAGGILMGYRRGPHLHVTDLTTPQSGDRRTQFGFDRKDERHQAYALTKWRQSGGQLDYVGEWHTHPENTPTPSTIDIREWRIICANHTGAMVFLILGNGDRDWLGVGNTSGIFQCDVAYQGAAEQFA